ncbi:MAG: imidazole glycerol phosphate synthase subunit HisH [Parvularculaceae bacterium]
MSVAIIDTGCANIASLVFAFARLGAEARPTADWREIASAERVVLPGVGAAGHAIENLGRAGLFEKIPGLRQPVLGVCLGMQLLYEYTEEGDFAGLGVFDGRVVRLASGPGLRTPHMGWSAVRRVADGPLVDGIEGGAYFYFLHSFAAPVSDDTALAAEHGATFTAAAARGNFFGCQFHPERSGAAGARVLRNFLEL